MIRDSRKNKEYFDKWIDYDLERLASMRKAIDAFPQELNSRHLTYLHNFTNKHLQILVYRFSRGDGLQDFERDIDAALNAFSMFSSARNATEEVKDAYPMDIDRSQQALWLAYFAIVAYERGSKLKSSIQQLLLTPDMLLNEVSEYVLGQKVLAESACVLQKLHEPLLNFCKLREIDGNKMIRFLATWYEKCDSSYWHETHDGEDRGYFGYWCFEAALVSRALGYAEDSFCSSIYYPRW
jgi:hypothetical protein